MESLEVSGMIGLVFKKVMDIREQEIIAVSQEDLVN